MKLIGLMPVRNEDWCLGLSARVALLWCDELVILLHACEDGTAQIVRELQSEHQSRVVQMVTGGEWTEMEHRQHMLQSARAREATHIAMIDADEVLTANLANHRIQALVNALQPGQMLELPGYNLRGSLNRYHSNGIWGNRWFSCAFKDTSEAHWTGDKFHSRNPAGVRWRNWRPINQGEGGILHLWGASERRLTAKHALYKVTERLRWPTKPTTEIERMYNLWRSPDDSWPGSRIDQTWGEPWTYANVPENWKHIHLMQHMELDREPWQEAEVRRLVQEHGALVFKGLDLFGVA